VHRQRPVKSVVTPQSVDAAFNVSQQLLADAGQPIEWLKQLRLGLERASGLPDPMVDRDREGRMRSAWDYVSTTNPIPLLTAVPNGSRASCAAALGVLYRHAAANAHAVSVARGWMTEAVRMEYRAAALAACPCTNVPELLDYAMVPGEVQHDVSDMHIAAALAAGVPPLELLRPSGGAQPGTAAATAPVLAGEAEAAAEVEADTIAMIREQFEAGNVTAQMVEELLGTLPAWAQTVSAGLGTAGGAEEVPPSPESPGSVVSAADSDAHVVTPSGPTVAEAAALAISETTPSPGTPGAATGDWDVGATSPNADTSSGSGSPDFGSASLATATPQPTPATGSRTTELKWNRWEAVLAGYHLAFFACEGRLWWLASQAFLSARERPST
jgi:hypothetical protein